MNISQLDLFLSEITESEKWHLLNPNMLSPFYTKVKKGKTEGQSIFYFDFDDYFCDENIFILKESRFTNIPLHYHKDMEMNYVYKGNDTYIVNGKSIELNEGDLILLDSDVYHSSKKTKSEDDIIINFVMKKYHFDSSFLRKINRDSIIVDFVLDVLERERKHDHFIVFNTQENEKFHTLMQYTLCEYFSMKDKRFNKSLFHSYIDILFQELMNTYYDNNLSNYLHIEKDHKLLDILDYIEKNFLECNLNDTAKLFGYNPKYLSQLIKKITGMNFKDLQIEKKLLVAADLLKKTTLPIQIIAEDSGFSNSNFFYKKFQEKFKVTPKDYRNKQNRGQYS